MCLPNEWTFPVRNCVIYHSTGNDLEHNRMSDSITKESNKRVFQHQELFRFLVGFAAIVTLLASRSESGYNAVLVVAMLISLVYLLTAYFIIRKTRKENKSLVNRALSCTDALLLGAIIALIDFDLLPSILFFTVVQFNALINGGIRRMLGDNLALAAGVTFAAIAQQPSWHVEAKLEISLVVLLAMVLHFCIYGYYSYTHNRQLKAKLRDLERQQIQLKLRNYRLSKYLSPTLRAAIQSGKDVKLETQRKKLTIFFSDIKGFSELAEEMETDALTSLLNNYLTEMSEIALKFGATVDKFVGDAIMVFFGDPVSHGTKADCVAAVSMAIAMKKHMKELQLLWLNQGIQKPLEIRMGINTGFCTVGNFGTENRLDYTLLGTEVNLASRLESAAEPGEILISHETYSLIKDLIMCRDKGEIKVKGFQQPVQVYSVIDMRKNLGKDQTYYEHITDGFSVYLDTDKVRNYDRDKIIASLTGAANKLKKKNIY